MFFLLQCGSSNVFLFVIGSTTIASHISVREGGNLLEIFYCLCLFRVFLRGGFFFYSYFVARVVWPTSRYLGKKELAALAGSWCS